jgi:hypothetical protein
VSVDRGRVAGQVRELGHGDAGRAQLLGTAAFGEDGGLAPGEHHPADARGQDVLDAGDRAGRAVAARDQ